MRPRSVQRGKGVSGWYTLMKRSVTAVLGPSLHTSIVASRGPIPMRVQIGQFVALKNKQLRSLALLCWRLGEDSNPGQRAQPAAGGAAAPNSLIHGTKLRKPNNHAGYSPIPIH